MSAVDEYNVLLAGLAQQGLGGKMGQGERPALLLVDLQNAFTSTASPLGKDIGPEMAAILRLQAAARDRGLPVIYTCVSYDPSLEDAGVWLNKIPANGALVAGSDLVELDARLERRPEELIIVKKHASPFWGTPLEGILTGKGIDTLVIAGLTTSGCVRATAVDGCARGFRPSVVREAVGDRSELSHASSLFDIGAKYGDILDLDDAITYMNGVEVRA
jgi:nicotinamidase-related amidase